MEKNKSIEMGEMEIKREENEPVEFRLVLVDWVDFG